jgi:hypothetical protein
MEALKAAAKRTEPATPPLRRAASRPSRPHRRKSPSRRKRHRRRGEAAQETCDPRGCQRSRPSRPAGAQAKKPVKQKVAPKAAASRHRNLRPPPLRRSRRKGQAGRTGEKARQEERGTEGRGEAGTETCDPRRCEEAARQGQAGRTGEKARQEERGTESQRGDVRCKGGLYRDGSDG